jgi:hypothetical protein
VGPSLASRISAIAFLILTWILPLPVAQAKDLGCVKREVKALMEQGLSKAERRKELLEPMDLASVRSRFDRAQALGEKDVLLPELRAEAIWAKQSLSDVETRIHALLERPEARERISLIAKELRARADALMADPRGVSLLDWNEFTDAYARFVDLGHADHSGLIEKLNAGQIDGPSRLKLHMEQVQDPAKLFRYDNWRWVPSMRPIDVSTMNEWMSHGLLPESFGDRFRRYDGAKKDKSVIDEIGHDRAHNHAISKATRPRRAIGQREYFELFRARLATRSADDTFRRIAETLWFYVYHDRGRGYSPESLATLLSRDETLNSLFVRLNQPHDLGEFFPNGLPTKAQLKETSAWLSDFAREVMTTYPAAEESKAIAR